VQGGSLTEGPRSQAEGPHDSAESSTGLFRSRSLLPAPSRERLQLGFSEAWRMVRTAPLGLVTVRGMPGPVFVCGPMPRSQ
jgi:hypothetical protein